MNACTSVNFNFKPCNLQDDSFDSFYFIDLVVSVFLLFFFFHFLFVG